MFWLPCIAAIAILPVLFITYRLKPGRWFWFLVIAPPLLLAPLIIMPVNSPIALALLFPLLLFLPASLLMLVIRAIQLLITRIRKKPAGILPLTFIRPGLVVLMFAIVALSQWISVHAADRVAFDLARRLQAQCDTSGHCPPFIDGWEKKPDLVAHSRYSSCYITKLGIDYKLDYDAGPDGKNFTVSISHGFNMGTMIKGGVGKTLKAYTITEGPSTEIPLDI